MKFRAPRLRVRCALLCLGLALTPAMGLAPAAAAEHPTSRVTLRAQNEPVRAVLLRLAHQTGANISVGEGVSGYVTLELHGVTLAQALRAILEPLGAGYRLRDGVYDIEASSGTARAGAAPDPL